MFKSLVYKEWLKIRWVFIGLAAINCLIVMNIYFDLSNTFKVYNANVVVGQFQAYEIVFYSDIKYILLLTGLILSIVQFFPEITQTRLKLTFHLPVKENKLMFQMISVGISLLVIIFLVDEIFLSVIITSFLPREFFESMIITSLPWYIGGICTYLWVVIVFTEPNWTKRIISIFVAVGIMELYYAGDGYSQYAPSLLYFVLLTVFCSAIVFLSAYNFKRGIC